MEYCTQAMIGGAPYLMGTLEKALSAKGIEAEYAFSERNVQSVTHDGVTENKVVFEFKGFIQAVEDVLPHSPNQTPQQIRNALNEDPASIVNVYYDEDFNAGMVYLETGEIPEKWAEKEMETECNLE